MDIPMLASGPLKVIRDAARVVQRKANLMIERVSANTLSTMVGLPGMIVTEYAIEQEVLHVFWHPEHEVALCPRCGKMSE